MKIVVTGGRAYQSRSTVFTTLDTLHSLRPIELLIHGACGWNADEPDKFGDMLGADRWADEWALGRGVKVTRVPAHWTRHKGQGGPIRNGEMLDMKPDMVVAFPGGPGTANCCRHARARKITVYYAVGGQVRLPL